jgi:hypothetical protein
MGGHDLIWEIPKVEIPPQLEMKRTEIKAALTEAIAAFDYRYRRIHGKISRVEFIDPS